MTKVEEHLIELLRLPLEERLRAAHALLDSVDDNPEDSDAEAANLAEWVRRLDELENGTVVGESVDEVVERIRARLRAKRDS